VHQFDQIFCEIPSDQKFEITLFLCGRSEISNFNFPSISFIR
jgi:hypothetical protein